MFRFGFSCLITASRVLSKHWILEYTLTNCKFVSEVIECSIKMCVESWHG